MTNTTKRKTIQSAETVFDILECIQRLDGAGVSEIAKELDYSKSTIHYYLTTLEQRQYLIRDGDCFRLGFQLVTLGAHARQQHELFDIVEQKTKYLAAESGAVAHTLVEDGGEGVFLSRAVGDRDVETHVGMRTDLHCTAYGKAILAHLPSESVDQILGAEDLPRRTAHTTTKREELTEQLETIRDISLAYADEEFAEGMSSIAAPILYGNTGEVYGAIGISDAPDQIPDPRKHRKARRFSGQVPEFVERTARIVSERIAEK